MSFKKPCDVPGLEATSEEDGNLGDVEKAGSLHEFLLGLHKQFGPIASFWWGKMYVISTASGKLFEEHKSLRNKPPKVFDMFKPFLGEKSLQYSVGEDGDKRRCHYDKGLNHDSIKMYFPEIQQVANEVAAEWSALVDKEKLPLSQYSFEFAMKAVLFTLFGKLMTNEQDVLHFKTAYERAWGEMELRLTSPPTEEREQKFQEDKKFMSGIIQRVMRERKENPPKQGEEFMLDYLLDFTDDEEIQFADSMCFAVAGYHTLAYLLTWAFYFIATHPDVDQKVYEEIKAVLGEADESYASMKDLVYLRQVIDETLRCSVVAPWGARAHDIDAKLGGYDIPKDTPIIHAFGVSFKDETAWPNPEKFDPDRFKKENKQERLQFSFPPFGFAANRVCPAEEYTYANSSIALVTLLRKFKVHLVEGQDVKPVYGFVTKPKEEIFVTLSKR